MRRALVMACVTFLAPSVALAQDAVAATTVVDPLSAAEAAYLEVDFETAQARAEDALTSGHYGADELVRIYRLLGITAVALGDTEQSRDYFVRMLALDPEARLDEGVPPRLRGPFLEARGMLSMRSGEQLSAELDLSPTPGAIRVTVSDPFHVARTVRLHARIEHASSYDAVDGAIGTEPIDLAVAGATSDDRIECWLELLDQFGNHLLTVASEAMPRTLGRAPITVAPVAPAPSDDTVLHWALAIGAGVVVVGAAIAITVVEVDLQSHVPVRTQLSIGF